MALILLDIPAFRAAFPAFASDTLYPDATVELYWTTATYYLSNQDYGCLRGDARRQALFAMVAHFLALADTVKSGKLTGVLSSATIDKITISLSVSPARSQWQWWLSQTPYGQQLSALLGVHSVAGFYIGGSPTRAAFRGPGGGFGPGC